jgi:hypothetical protein
VDNFMLDEEGQCYENERDNIFFPRTWLSTYLVKLRTLK